MHENRIARAIERTITTMQLISVAEYSIYSNFIKENFVYRFEYPNIDK